MKKSEIIKEITDKTGVENQQVEAILNTFMDSIINHTLNKEYIALSGFGRFGIKKRAAKMGRNISMNSSMKISAHFAPNFKPSSRFKEQVKKLNKLEKV